MKVRNSTIPLEIQNSVAIGGHLFLFKDQLNCDQLYADSMYPCNLSDNLYQI